MTHTPAQVAERHAAAYLDLQRQAHVRAAEALTLGDYSRAATEAHRAHQAGLQGAACTVLAHELLAMRLTGEGAGQ